MHRKKREGAETCTRAGSVNRLLTSAAPLATVQRAGTRGKKAGVQRIWELAEIEEQDYATWDEKKLRSQERLREACELMQQIFDMEKEHEEQQARQGSSSIINENENSSEPTSVFEYIPSP